MRFRPIVHWGRVVTAGPNSPRAEFYRQRAEALMRQAEAVSDEETHRTWVELANAWFELAKRAEGLEQEKKTGI